MNLNDARRQFFVVAERMQGTLAGQLRKMLGEEAYDQRIFTDAERERRVEALIKCAYDGHDTPEARHQSWCRMHIESGWVWGPEFRPDLKQHPNLVEWADLPATAQAKANIFALVATLTASLFSVALTLRKDA